MQSTLHIYKQEAHDGFTAEFADKITRIVLPYLYLNRCVVRCVASRSVIS